MKNYQKIEKLLAGSNLSTDQVDELMVLFERSDDEELLSVIEVLSEDISLANSIYKNYRAKKNAFEKNDAVEIENIFKEEIEILDKM